MICIVCSVRHLAGQVLAENVCYSLATLTSSHVRTELNYSFREINNTWYCQCYCTTGMQSAHGFLQDQWENTLVLPHQYK